MAPDPKVESTFGIDPTLGSKGHRIFGIFLKRLYLAHRTFTDADNLEAAIDRSVSDMNRERATVLSYDSLRITA